MPSRGVLVAYQNEFIVDTTKDRWTLIMVISHLHAFIYLPMPKTGSRSLRNALLSFGAKTVQYGGVSREEANHQMVTPDEYAYYTTFTTIRNPFRRSLSCYLYEKQRPQQRYHQEVNHLTFTDFLLKYYDSVVGTQSSLLAGCRIDHIVKYEEDIPKQIAQFLPSVQPLHLEHRNKSFYDKPWKDYFTEDAVEIIRNKAVEDFLQFGYSNELKD